MNQIVFPLLAYLSLAITNGFAQEPKAHKIDLPTGRYLLIEIDEPKKDTELHTGIIDPTFGVLKKDSETQYTFTPEDEKQGNLVLTRDEAEPNGFQALVYDLKSVRINSIGFAHTNSDPIEITLTVINTDGSSLGRTLCKLVYLGQKK